MALHLSPGVSTEAGRVYLAQRLTIGSRTGEAEGEEAFLTTRWLPLEEAVSWVLDRRVRNLVRHADCESEVGKVAVPRLAFVVEVHPTVRADVVQPCVAQSEDGVHYRPG